MIHDTYFTLFKVDGKWGSWSPWSNCSKTCGEGRISRTRECDSPAPAHGGETCPGIEIEDKICNNGPCKGKNGNFNLSD